MYIIGPVAVRTVLLLGCSRGALRDDDAPTQLLHAGCRFLRRRLDCWDRHRAKLCKVEDLALVAFK